MTKTHASETPQTELREDHHLISPTAKLVAHLRADTDIPFSKQIDELCDAEAITNELFGNKENFGWMSAMLELRYKSLSALLKQELQKQDISQVIELAAGVQPRGIIESTDPAITYIETDLPDMAKEKRAIVETIDPNILKRKNYRIQPLNVLDTEEFVNLSESCKPEKVAIINEGLFPYLNPEEKVRAAKNIRSMLVNHGGVWITPDLSNSGRIKKIIETFPGAEEYIKRINIAVGRNLKENSIGDKDATLAFFRSLGFDIREYKQIDLVQDLVSISDMKDESVRDKVIMALEDSGVWVLEASK